MASQILSVIPIGDSRVWALGSIMAGFSKEPDKVWVSGEKKYGTPYDQHRKPLVSIKCAVQKALVLNSYMQQTPGLCT